MGLEPGTGAWDLGQVLEEEWDSNSENRGEHRVKGNMTHTVMSEAPQGIRARGWGHGAGTNQAGKCICRSMLSSPQIKDGGINISGCVSLLIMTAHTTSISTATSITPSITTTTVKAFPA